MLFGKLFVEDHYDEFRTDWRCRRRRTAALAVSALVQAAIEHPGYRPHFYPKSNRQKLGGGQSARRWRLLSRQQLTERVGDANRVDAQKWRTLRRSARKACRHVYDALSRDWDPISPWRCSWYLPVL